MASETWSQILSDGARMRYGRDATITGKRHTGVAFADRFRGEQEVTRGQSSVDGGGSASVGHFEL